MASYMDVCPVSPRYSPFKNRPSVGGSPGGTSLFLRNLAEDERRRSEVYRPFTPGYCMKSSPAPPGMADWPSFSKSIFPHAFALRLHFRLTTHQSNLLKCPRHFPSKISTSCLYRPCTPKSQEQIHRLLVSRPVPRST